MTFRFFHSCTLICLALTGWAATEVQNHQVLQNLSGSQGSETHFFIQVPSGADTLTITISGGSGDPDLYVRQGSPATRSQYDCRPYLNGPNEECQIDQPSGIYYILVRGYTAYSGLSLTAAYNDGSPLALASGVPLGPLSGAQDEQLNFYLDVPQGASDLRFEISGGNGDPDLYVRYGSQPSLTQYDCRPWLNGPNELCAIAQPQAGTYFVMLVGYNAFSGLTLSAQFEPPADCGPDDTSWISMNDLGDGTVTQNQYASYVRLMGSGLANYQIEICQPAQLGTVTFDYDPIQIGGGYDQYFTYTYSHLGPRPNNADSFQIKASKNGNTALKTLKLNLQNPIVENPVQPNCSNIDVDLDQDGIPDCAEQPGSTFYGMPLYDWGARPNQPDIFIEVDYMPIHELRDYDGNLVLDSHGHPIMDHGTQPLRESLDIITAIYADHGYALHFDIGDLYDQAPGLDPYDYDLGGGEEVPYAEYIHLNRWTDTYHGRTIPIPGMVEDFMPQYFANRPERSRVFYYCLFANSQGGSNRGSSGQAFDTFDQAFYISMGGTGWRLSDDTPANRNMLINGHASTLFHEFGHIFGHSHGGDPEGEELNFKPNYLSSMNYLFQLQGVPKDYSDLSAYEMVLDRYQLDHGYSDLTACYYELADRRPDNYRWGELLHGLFGDPAEFNIDFSNGEQPNLNEAALAESSTLGGMDFNCDGQVTANNQRFDINFDGNIGVLPDFDDWGQSFIFFRYLNYAQGKFQITPNVKALNAWWPSQAFDGAPSPPPGKTRSPGTKERVLPPEVFAAIHRIQNR